MPIGYTFASNRTTPWPLLFVLLVLASLFASCTSDSTAPTNPGPAYDPVVSLFSTSENAAFFDAPFPVEHMRREDGTIRYDLLPNPQANPVAQHFLDQADRETSGFSRIGVVYLPFDGPINEEALPAPLTGSLKQEATVFLVNVDRTSIRYGERIPIYTRWQAEPTVYLPGNLLMLLP